MDRTSCTCEACVGACQHRPGWFLPGEVERVAAYLGKPLAQLFQEDLAIDWLWSRVHQQYCYVLAPRLQQAEGGREYPAEPGGTCVFLKEGRCTIHPVKPSECAQMLHTDSMEAKSARRWAIAYAWKDDTQVAQLLGRVPQAAPLTFAQQLREEVDGVTR